MSFDGQFYRSIDVGLCRWWWWWWGEAQIVFDYFFSSSSRIWKIFALVLFYCFVWHKSNHAHSITTKISFLLNILHLFFCLFQLNCFFFFSLVSLIDKTLNNLKTESKTILEIYKKNMFAIMFFFAKIILFF